MVLTEVDDFYLTVILKKETENQDFNKRAAVLLDTLGLFGRKGVYSRYSWETKQAHFYGFA